jgi:hypothetical protein
MNEMLRHCEAAKRLAVAIQDIYKYIYLKDNSTVGVVGNDKPAAIRLEVLTFC